MITQPTPYLLEHIRAMARAMRIHAMSMEDARYAFEREFIIATMIEKKGNACQAAIALGVHRNTLTRDFHRLNIDQRHLRQLRTIKGSQEAVIPLDSVKVVK